MDVKLKNRVTEVLVEIVRESLVRGETIEVPGLGLFRVHHQLSQIEEQADGQVLMIPPRDEVAFVPQQ